MKIKQITNNSKPLVSVIIPVFNGALYLIEAVDSVVKSTYKNIEIILIDDGSKDASKELCHMLEKNTKMYISIHMEKTAVWGGC